MPFSAEQMCQRLDGPPLGPQLHPLKPKYYEWRPRSGLIYNRGLENGGTGARIARHPGARFARI